MGELLKVNCGVICVQEEGYEEIRGEIEMLQQCSHPNVVRYLGSYQGEEYLWVGDMDFIAYLYPRCQRFNAFRSVILIILIFDVFRAYDNIML